MVRIEKINMLESIHTTKERSFTLSVKKNLMGKEFTNLGNTQNEKIITKELKIAENVFIYNETMIQLCNISRISLTKAPKQPYRLIHIILLIVGILLLFQGEGFLFAGLLLGAIGAIFLLNTYSENQDTGEYIVLDLNCGRGIFLYCKSHDFAIALVDTMINCINSKKEYRINMENCKIEACQFGDDNLMVRR